MTLAEQWHALRPDEPATPALEACLAAALATSRAAYPAVEVPDAEWLAFVAARLPANVAAGDALAAVCLADLFVACAILRGDGAALHAFERVHLAGIDAAIAHLDGGSALADDVRTAVRDRVLAHGGKSKLAEYQGRGDLRGWLRVVALREALQLLRARRREAPLPDDLATKLAANLAIEPPALAGREREVYREAFAGAFAALTARERNLLRQHYVHGATVDELGGFYRVHRATAARWIAQIRETLLVRTRRHVGDALRLTGTELDSAMAKAAEHLEYSLRQTLSYEH